MKEKITTASGSVYIIDYDAKTWEREKGVKASTIRSDNGRFEEILFPIIFLGEGPSLRMICPPFVDGVTPRIITSTPIVSREKI